MSIVKKKKQKIFFIEKLWQCKKNFWKQFSVVLKTDSINATFSTQIYVSFLCVYPNICSDSNLIHFSFSSCHQL